MAPDTTHPVERSGSGSTVTAAATAAATATGTAPPSVAAPNLAVIHSPGDARTLRASLLRSTGLTIHLSWGEEVALGQLGPDGQCHRVIGVRVEGPVGFQGVGLVEQLDRELGLLHVCRIVGGEEGCETFVLG